MDTKKLFETPVNRQVAAQSETMKFYQDPDMTVKHKSQMRKSDNVGKGQDTDDEIQIDNNIEMGEGPSQLVSVERSRLEQQELDREIERVISMIEQKDFYGLDAFFENNKMPVSEFKDQKGYTLLHIACYKNIESIAFYILRKVKNDEGPEQLKRYILAKTKDEEFHAIHFASFRGNVKLCKKLLEEGADIYCRNKFGINVMHVAAQGDEPQTLYFFKQKGLDLRAKDQRGSTPLHWAAYSKSEVALQYLLAWVYILDDQDNEGNTPLHLAVKKA